MKRWIWAGLAGVLALALAMRFLPLWQYLIWGSDSGEYFVLCSRLVGTSAISTDYSGWGFGYPYFPGMFILTGELQLLTGIPMLQAMQWAAPFVASLSVLVIFLITVRAFDDARAGLIAGGILAVVTPVVYATSHPMPGSIGDLLALLCILLLLRSLESRAALVALGLATAALVMTHHLSTFFVLIPVVVTLLARELIRVKTDRRRTMIEGGYALCLLSGTMLFWYGYATPFRERVIPEGFGLSPLTVLFLAYATLLLVPFLVWLRRRLAPGFRYRPAFPSVRRVVLLCVTFIVGGAAVLSTAALLTNPGTAINVDDRVAYWFLPVVLVMAVGTGGISRAEFSREGYFVQIWIVALALTMLFGIATNSDILLPARQTQYFFEPLAVLAGAGAVFLHDNWNPDGRKALSAAAAAGISAALVMCAATAYPPREIMGGFEEGTTPDEMDGVLWLREGGPPAELVASDHRMSSVTFGFTGQNVSWDNARATLLGNQSAAQSEMAGLETLSGLHRVTLVLLTPSVTAGAAFTHRENARPITGEALSKFSSELFLKMYESNGVKVFRANLPG